MDTLNGAVTEFKSALEGLGISVGNEFLPMLTEFVKGAKSVVEWLGKLNPDTVELGLKMSGAAAGTAIAVSSLAKLRLAIKALQVSMGPTGWLMLGLSSLAALFVGVTHESERHNEVSLDKAKAMREEKKSLEDVIRGYEGLKEKNKLTNQEMLEFLDIQDKIKLATDPEQIKRLEDRYSELQEKSGLTNQQMSEFIGYNDQLLEKVPQSDKVVSDFGNSWAKTADEANRAVEAMQRGLEIELEKQVNTSMDNLDENLRKRSEALEEHNRLGEESLGIQQELFNAENELAVKQLVYNSLSEAEKITYQETLDSAKGRVKVLEDQHREKEKLLLDQEELINGIDQEIIKGNQATQQIIDMRMEQIGITAEKGKEIEAIKKAIEETENLIAKKTEEFKVDGKITDEEQEQLDKLNEKLGTLENTRGAIQSVRDDQDKLTEAIEGSTSEMKDYNYEADKDLEKWIETIVTEDPDELNEKYGKTIEKDVPVDVDPSGRANAKIDDMTKDEEKNIFVRIWESIFKADKNSGSRHSGGTVHQLPKYHGGGNVKSDSNSNALAASMASRPKFDEVDVRLLRNEMVLTQAQLFNALDRSINAESALIKIADSLDRAQSQGGGNGTTTLVVQTYLNGRVIAEETVDDTAELLERKRRHRERARGER